MTTDRPHLHALAERCGIALRYRGYHGGDHVASPATLEALLAALGFAADDEAHALEALRSLDAREAQPGLEPVRVLRSGAPDLASARVQLEASVRGPLSFRIELVLESGAMHVREGKATAEHAALDLPLPAAPDLAPGYHSVHCEISAGTRNFASEQTLIIAPPSCVGVEERVGSRRALGIWGHLYSLWSARSFGIGDLRDLEVLVAWAAARGLDFVGINPLHAMDGSAREVNPYYALSRLYRDPIYVDPARVLERADPAGAAALLADSTIAALRAELTALPRVDYTRVHALKQPLLAAAHRAFLARHAGRGTALDREHAEYRAREGAALDRFATFCALRERNGGDFHDWPAHYRDVHTREVAEFAAREHAAVDFHAFLQHELEAQLGQCAEAARTGGMSLGLYGDLALGDAPFSGDVWARPEQYATGVSVGAPPDPYSDAGQEWGLVPFHPLALREDRYRTLRALMRQAFRHGGVLRIDHVMGLGRQFWVPAGRPATEGAYVRFPLADVLGVLALESRRAGALVIGEDLGVVPEGLRELMAEQNMLRSQVMYFERRPGWQHHPGYYARGALATASTHDLPPLTGYWTGHDLQVRRRSGNIASDEALAQALAERAQFRTDMLGMLRFEKLLPEGPGEPSMEALVEAVYVLLASAASRLVGVALDDLTLEHEALNTPASYLAEAPNWSRRSRMSLEQLAADPRIRALVDRLVERARHD